MRKQLSFGIATLLFLTAFIYKMSEILVKHSCWCDFKEPAGFGEILFALFCGLAAVVTAIGIDVHTILRGFGINMNSREGDKPNGN